MATKAKATLGWQDSKPGSFCFNCGELVGTRGGRMFRSAQDRTFCEPCKERSDLEALAQLHAWYPANRRKAVDKEFRGIAARLREAAERVERDVERALTREGNDADLERQADALLNELNWILPNLHPQNVYAEIREYRKFQAEAAAFFAAHPELAPAKAEGTDGDA